MEHDERLVPRVQLPGPSSTSYGVPGAWAASSQDKNVKRAERPAPGGAPVCRGK